MPGTDLKVSRSLDGYTITVQGPDVVAKRFVKEVVKMGAAEYKKLKDYNPLHAPFWHGDNGVYEIWGLLNEATACILPSSGNWIVNTGFTEETAKE
jgi:hypothetical protein